MQAIDFLQRCLVIDPKKRMTMQEALNHPYLASFKDNEKILTFPQSPFSDSDREALAEYYEFEAAIDESKTGVNITAMKAIREKIWDEMMRYHPTLPKKIPFQGSSASRGGLYGFQKYKPHRQVTQEEIPENQFMS